MAFVPPLPASSLTTVAKASLATPTTFKGAQLRNASLRSQRRAVIRAAAVPMEVDGETFDSEVLAASSVRKNYHNLAFCIQKRHMKRHLTLAIL